MDGDGARTGAESVRPYVSVSVEFSTGSYEGA